LFLLSHSTRYESALPPRALFLFDASATVGVGHAMRSLVLADALHLHYGWHCTLQITPACRAMIASWIHPHHRVIQTATSTDTPSPASVAEKFHVAIVDDYTRGRDVEQSLYAHAEQVWVIDDLPRRDHQCDLLLDPTHGRVAAQYRGRVPETATLLTGSGYALLRPQFVRQRWASAGASRHDRPAVPHVVVTLGGGTWDALLSCLHRALLAIRRPLRVTCVVPGPPGSIPVSMPMDGAGPVTITVTGWVASMAELVAEADLVMGGAGGAAWERCVLGVPSLLIQLADNQCDVIAALVSAGAACSLGPGDTLITAVDGEQQITAVVAALLDDPARLQTMRRAALGLCDGLGVWRMLIQALPEPARDHRPVTLRLATMADAGCMLAWQCHPATRRWARNPEPPTPEGHQHWLQHRLIDPDCIFHLIEYDGQPAGVLRLDRYRGLATGRVTFEISILVDPGLYRCGIAAAALRLAARLVPECDLYAEVLHGNDASMALFLRTGYRPVHELTGPPRVGLLSVPCSGLSEPR
jgi:UDP-2,4-diacetamido-2,4,6-trideoxy-beta-L-altropyranose hydrolase